MSEIRETVRALSDQALAFQRTLYPGGSWRDEIEDEIQRRAETCECGGTFYVDPPQDGVAICDGCGARR